MTESAARIVLVGVAGAGKSTVARILDQAGAGKAIDVDQLVAQQLGAEFSTLVITGHPGLEQARTDAALHAISTPGAVVALGASQIHDEQVVNALQQAKAKGTHVVELLATTSDVAARMGLNAARPVALGAPRAMLTSMMKAHHEACQDLVDETIDTHGMDATQVAHACAQACKMSDGLRFPQ